MWYAKTRDGRAPCGLPIEIKSIALGHLPGADVNSENVASGWSYSVRIVRRNIRRTGLRATNSVPSTGAPAQGPAGPQLAAEIQNAKYCNCNKYNIVDNGVVYFPTTVEKHNSLVGAPENSTVGVRSFFVIGQLVVGFNIYNIIANSGCRVLF